MSDENYEMLVKNVEMLMRKQRINQADLIKATGILQPQMSKCMNRKNKGQFTLEQIWKIADYFQVSIDFLVGRNTSVGKKGAPSAVTVCKQLMQLMESEMVRLKEFEVEESMFTADCCPAPNAYPYSQQRGKNKYTAFYFSNYIRPDIFNFSEDGLDDLGFDFGTGGNFAVENAKINDFLEYYLKLYDLLKKNDLPRDIFDTAIADRLKTMEE